MKENKYENYSEEEKEEEELNEMIKNFDEIKNDIHINSNVNFPQNVQGEITLLLYNNILSKLKSSLNQIIKKKNQNDNYLCEIGFSEENHCIYLKISFNYTFLIFKIQYCEMLINKNLLRNIEEFTLKLYYDDLENTIFNEIFFTDKQDLEINIFLQNGEMNVIQCIENENENYQIEEKCNLYKDDIGNFPKIPLNEDFVYSFFIGEKFVDKLVLIFKKFVEINNDRNTNFFELHLFSNEKILIVKKDNNKGIYIKVYFNIILQFMKNDNLKFGDYFTYGTIDFSKFLSSFIKGKKQKILFFLTKNGELKVETEIYNIENSEVIQMFNPVLNQMIDDY